MSVTPALRPWMLILLAVSAPLCARPLLPPLPAVDECVLTTSATTLDYGVRSLAQLHGSSRGDYLTPGRRRIQVRISCPRPRSMALHIASADRGRSTIAYGEQGRLQVEVQEVMLDGSPVALSLFNTQGGRRETANQLLAGDEIRLPEKVSGRLLVFWLEFEPQLLPLAASGLQSSEANLRLSLVAPGWRW